jgi:hypothetical protein
MTTAATVTGDSQNRISPRERAHRLIARLQQSSPFEQEKTSGGLDPLLLSVLQHHSAFQLNGYILIIYV